MGGCEAGQQAFSFACLAKSTAARCPTGWRNLRTDKVHHRCPCRPVTVSRLLVKDSIEHRVLAVQESKHALFAGADGAAEDTAGVQGEASVCGVGCGTPVFCNAWLHSACS